MALAARNVSALREIAEEYPDATCVLPLDVTDEEALSGALKKAAAHFGGLDCVIANAGIGIPTAARAVDAATMRKVLEVNLIAASITLVKGLPFVEESPVGLLVGISSLAGHRGGPRSGPYNASKAGFSRFMESLRSELGSTHVRVLDIRPGFVRTPMTNRNRFRMPFLLEPDDAARRMANAIEKRRSHLTYPRRMGALLGILRHMPDGLFDRLARRVARRASHR